jgi:hypothetical protein
VLEQQTLPIIKAFLNDNSYNHGLKEKAGILWHRMCNMQKRVRA